MSLKFSTSRSVTTSPISVGANLPPIFGHILPFLDGLRIAEYVEGRPMPRSSSSFTSDASLKRGGGSVKCCSGFSSFSLSFCPASSAGNLCFSASSSSSFESFDFLVDLQEAVELQNRTGNAER